jgi:hypothetical protein
MSILSSVFHKLSGHELITTNIETYMSLCFPSIHLTFGRPFQIQPRKPSPLQGNKRNSV